MITCVSPRHTQIPLVFKSSVYEPQEKNRRSFKTVFFLRCSFKFFLTIRWFGLNDYNLDGVTVVHHRGRGQLNIILKIVYVDYKD